MAPLVSAWGVFEPLPECFTNRIDLTSELWPCARGLLAHPRRYRLCDHPTLPAPAVPIHLAPASSLAWRCFDSLPRTSSCRQLLWLVSGACPPLPFDAPQGSPWRPVRASPSPRLLIRVHVPCHHRVRTATFD
eukprot:contig_3945_g871